MKRAVSGNSSMQEQGTAIEFASSVVYRVQSGATHCELMSDARSFLGYALYLIEHLSFELRDDGGQLAANPIVVSELLEGAAQHLQVSLAAMKESEKQAPGSP